MKEIEVKFKIADRDYDTVKGILEKHLTSKEKSQRDDVFLMPEQIGKPIIAGSKIYRIRTVEVGGIKKSLFTLKVQTEKPLVSDEYEFEIADAQTARKALLASGLQKRVTVQKTRIEGKIHQYNLCLDEVAGLGVFIEIELMLQDDDADINKIQKDMPNLLKTLGLQGEICLIPYDTQLENLKKK